MRTTYLRTYSELRRLKTYDARYDYLRLSGKVGEPIWNSHRRVNQLLYQSKFWMEVVRPKVITRDRGCDLGVYGYDITVDRDIIVHHMNPITEEDIINEEAIVFDPEYLITVSRQTHNDIHYGILRGGLPPLGERFENDMAPWKL